MKARFVLEAVNFERGKDPMTSMGLGDRFQKAEHLIQKRIDERNPRLKDEYRWRKFYYHEPTYDIEWTKISHHGGDETITLRSKYNEIIYYRGSLPGTRISLKDGKVNGVTDDFYAGNNKPFDERIKLITDRI